MAAHSESPPGVINILDLPSELIESVATYLSDADVFATRLSNRSFERSCLAHFGKRFFRKKGYMLTTPSLAVLQQVAEHNDLSKYVQHVWWNPDCFTFVRPDCAPDPQEAPDPDDPDSLLKLLSPGDRKKFEAYLACKQDHAELMRGSAEKLAVVLSKAFRSLPNLKTVGMRRSEDHSPWGWSRLKADVGQDPRVLGWRSSPSAPSNTLSGPTKLFIAIIRAVASANVGLRRLYTDAVEIDNIRPGLLTEVILDKACCSIWYLEINAIKAWLRKKQGVDYITLDDDEASMSGDGLVKLLQACRDLKEIGLQTFPEVQRPHRPTVNTRGQHWSTSYSYFCTENIGHHGQLARLQRVKLEKLVTTPAILLAILEPSKHHLQSLKLRDLRLLGSDEHPRPWAPIFALLLQSCPKLASILFYHLLYQDGGVSFIEDPTRIQVTESAPSPVTDSAFIDFDNLIVRAEGGEAVERTLGKIVDEHWYLRPIYSYFLDEELWHTDTSDEDY